MSQKIITKCDRCQKMRENLKVWQILQSVTRGNYRVWNVSQSVAVIRKWDVTLMTK